MIFQGLIVENFFSIAEPVTWNMENQGLVCITGKNHDSRAADSNGSGKSTLFEALVWVLWGKTVRGYTGDAVVNRRVKKNCRVTVNLIHDGEVYTVHRYRKHKTGKNGLEFQGPNGDLTQGTASLTQKKLENFLGIDYDTFINGPMMPQGNFKRFSAMTDSEQKAIFDQALQTAALKHAQDEVKDRLSRAHLRLAKASAELEGVLEAVEEQKALLERYDDERAQWKLRHRFQLATLANELTEVVVQQDKLWEKSRVVDFEAAINRAKKKVSDATRQKTAIEDEWQARQQTLRENIAQMKAALHSHNAQAKRLNQQIAKFKDLEGGVCPTCEQNVTESHVESCILELTSQVQEAVGKGDNCTTEAEYWKALLQEEKDKIEEKLSNLAEVYESRHAAYLDVVNEASEATAWVKELAALDRQESTLRKHYRERRAEIFPYDTLVGEANEQLQKLYRAMMIKRSAVRGLEIEIEHLEFWKYGFSNKGLKSYILDSVTPFLNDRANFYAQALTGGEIEISFSTQTTLRSGEVREKFSVTVTNKNGADTYAGNSGGEKGRADLSITFSLSDLVASRANQAYPQRFLDEPFEGLDEAGVEAVMELLSEMSADAGSIFVITHSDTMKGMFPKTITMVKANGKAAFECPN